MSAILACTDGSIYSTSVYEHAAWAAKRLGSDVQALHVIETFRDWPPSADFSGAIGVGAAAALTAEMAALDEARARVDTAKSGAILADARQRLEAAGLAPEAVTTVARHTTLIEAVDELGTEADLIVIGKRGESADFEKGFLGSQLERVIRSVSQPVLVASRAFRPVERFLIAFDGGPSSRKAADYVTTHPLLAGAECHLLMIAPPDSAHRDAFDATAAGLRAAGFVVKASVIETGEPEEIIAAEVRGCSIDLLVMGAFGHSRLRRFFLGSTTSDLVRTCLVPVLMLR